MNFKSCRVLSIINKKGKMSLDDMSALLYKCETKENYLVLNYIEKQLMLSHGRDFFIKSSRKIEVIASLISAKRDAELYKLYSSSFTAHQEAVGHTVEGAIDFNIIFIAYISFAMKALRKAAAVGRVDEVEEDDL